MTTNEQIATKFDEMAGLFRVRAREEAHQKGRLATVEAQLEELTAVPPPAPDPDPEPEPDPEPDPGPDPEPEPDPEPPIVVDPPGGELVELATSDLQLTSVYDPADDWEPYRNPTEGDCDWILDGEDGVARSTRGLGVIPFDGGSVAGHAYRTSRRAGHDQGPVTLGVRGDGGEAVVGGKWNALHPFSVCNDSGRGDVSVRIVGLTDDAQIGLGFSTKFGFGALIHVHRIGLKGGSDSFVMRATEGCGTLILDDWWVGDTELELYTSVLHPARTRKAVYRRYRHRRRDPNAPGIGVREHIVYSKDVGAGGLWYLENDMRGGNRTFTQQRPGADEPYEPSRGPIVFLDNVSEGYGWEHSSASGGSCITVWNSVDQPIVIARNRITDARYGCITVSGQPYGFNQFANVDRNHYGARGYPNDLLLLEANECSNPRGDRETVSISCVHTAKIWANNRIDGQLVINSPWAQEKSCPTRPAAKVCDTVELIGGLPAGASAKTFDPERPGKVRSMTRAELEALLV